MATHQREESEGQGNSEINSTEERPLGRRLMNQVQRDLLMLSEEDKWRHRRRGQVQSFDKETPEEVQDREWERRHDGMTKRRVHWDVH
jgi:hypothetical protein